MHWKLGAAGFVAGLAWSAGALAESSLPNAIYFVDVGTSNNGNTIPGQVLTSAGSVNVKTTAPANPDFPSEAVTSFATGTLSVYGEPAPTIDTNVLTEGYAYAGASASLYYYFEIAGPSNQVPVSVISNGSVNIPWVFDAYGAALSSGNAQLSFEFGTLADGVDPSDLDIYNVADAIVPAYNYSAVINNNNTAFIYHMDQTFELDTNTLYVVGLHLNINVYNNVNYYPYRNVQYEYAPAGASGYIDPIFTVMGPESNQYSLEFSSGIGDSLTPSVPESSPWIMLLIGFGGVGLAASQHSRKIARANSDAIRPGIPI